MRIYLASPKATDEEKVMKDLIKTKLEMRGHTVKCMFDEEFEILRDAEDVGYAKFINEVERADGCDEIWVLNFGKISDSNIAWLLGWAYGKGKVTRQLCLGMGEHTFGCMMIHGCDEWDFMENFILDKDNELTMFES